MRSRLRTLSSALLGPAIAVALALAASACDAEPGAPSPLPDPPFLAEGRYVDRVYEDPSDEIYAPENLPRFDLHIPPHSIARLEADGRQDVPATLVYRGERLEVGVHLRGETSYRPLVGKASFKIAIDAFVPGQTLRGLRRLTLKNAVQDNTHVAERLAYEVARALDVPAPRANNATVFVNYAYYGVYVNLEAYDKTFLKRRFGSSKGNLYEEGGADLEPGGVAAFERKNHEEDTDRSDLARLAAALEQARPEGFLEAVDELLDVDGFLRFAALELVVGQADGYAFKYFTRNNFYLYGEPRSGRFQFLPTGLDQTFRSSVPPEVLHPWMDEEIVYLAVDDARGLVLRKCLQSAPCRERYRAAVEAALVTFERLDVAGRARTYGAQIAEALAADPRKEVTMEAVERRRRELARYVEGRAPHVRRALARGALRR